MLGLLSLSEIKWIYKHFLSHKKLTYEYERKIIRGRVSTIHQELKRTYICQSKQRALFITKTAPEYKVADTIDTTLTTYSTNSIHKYFIQQN